MAKKKYHNGLQKKEGTLSQKNIDNIREFHVQNVLYNMRSF